MLRGCLLLGIVLAGWNLRAQDDGPVKMTPEFALTFPVTKTGPHDVTVKFPVFVNPATVVKPGMVLRVIYLPPVPTDDSEDLVLAHKGNMAESFSRSTLTEDEKAKMSPEVTHELERQRRRVWEVPNNFVLAIAQYPTDTMHLIYSPKGTDKDLDDEKFNFFEGMFIGLPGDNVQVLAVEKGSRADQAGVKAGDDITAVGGTPVQSDLDSFALAYAAAKKLAKDRDAASFPLSIRSAGHSEARTLDIPMPPTIKSGLMNGFKDL